MVTSVIYCNATTRGDMPLESQFSAILEFCPRRTPLVAPEQSSPRRVASKSSRRHQKRPLNTRFRKIRTYQMTLTESPLLGCVGSRIHIGKFVETHPVDRSSSLSCSMHNGSPGPASNTLSCNHMSRKSTPSRCRRSRWIEWMAPSVASLQ